MSCLLVFAAVVWGASSVVCIVVWLVALRWGPLYSFLFGPDDRR